ncbi:hypothetical protein EVAR_32475_1 [Eumeta japonica]|uniref:Uncharacterized protein n=1 Tax=Eumeta variegata TaxID=151549 RepID=A0A4C1VLS7_EUMVA|nr:hypothetical protein EVAR_32475_1 [Eumeta japonica]
MSRSERACGPSESSRVGVRYLIRTEERGDEGRRWATGTITHGRNATAEAATSRSYSASVVGRPTHFVLQPIVDPSPSVSEAKGFPCDGPRLLSRHRRHGARGAGRGGKGLPENFRQSNDGRQLASSDTERPLAGKCSTMSTTACCNGVADDNRHPRRPSAEPRGLSPRSELEGSWEGTPQNWGN